MLIAPELPAPVIGAKIMPIAVFRLLCATMPHMHSTGGVSEWSNISIEFAFTIKSELTLNEQLKLELI